MSDPTPNLKIDTSVPHSARVWNHWLGGKDNYPIDRQVGDHVRQVYPAIVNVARHSRAFLGRAVRYLAGEAGITQFLDIGTGLPTVDNTHEVAQRVNPAARIVYVDNDPLVLVHARALLTSTPEGACDYIDADVRDPGRVLARASATLDFAQPIALMMLGILGNVWDDDEATAICDHLIAALPPGSHLVLEDGTNAVDPDAAAQAEKTRAEAGGPLQGTHPRPARRVLPRPSAHRTRRGVGLPLAVRGHPLGRAGGGHRLRRRRQETLTGSVEPPRTRFHRPATAARRATRARRAGLPAGVTRPGNRVLPPPRRDDRLL